jgi:hypothetical protein
LPVEILQRHLVLRGGLERRRQHSQSLGDAERGGIEQIDRHSEIPAAAGHIEQP